MYSIGTGTILRVGAQIRSRSLASSSTAASYYDVVIVGGGMVGNALACSLGLTESFRSKKVLLLEGSNVKSLPTKAPEIFSNRVSAVSPTSIDFFKKLGIWDRLRQYRVKRVDRLQVLESCSQAAIFFEPPSSGSEIAYIVENDAIISALYDRVQEGCKNVDFRVKAAVKECSIPSTLDGLARITLEDGSEVETALVVGADGARSKVRDTSGVDFTGWNYEQTAIVGTLNIHEAGENGTAWQRFSPFGPIALLPLSPTVSSLVWTTSPEDAKRLLALPPDQFVDQLNHYLWTDEDQISEVNQAVFLLGKVASLAAPLFRSRTYKPSSELGPPTVLKLQTDTRASFPLGFGHAHSYIGTRFALIGDAAHRMHPLAGQGVNLGWSDVITLTKELSKAIESGADIGSPTSLAGYDTAAQRHNVPVMVAVDWLNRLYRTTAPPVVLLRSLGLGAVNGLTPVKDLLIHQLSAPRA